MCQEPHQLDAGWHRQSCAAKAISARCSACMELITTSAWVTRWHNWGIMQHRMHYSWALIWKLFSSFKLQISPLWVIWRPAWICSMQAINRRLKAWNGKAESQSDAGYWPSWRWRPGRALIIRKRSQNALPTGVCKGGDTAASQKKAHGLVYRQHGRCLEGLADHIHTKAWSMVVRDACVWTIRQVSGRSSWPYPHSSKIHGLILSHKVGGWQYHGYNYMLH